MTDTRKRGIEYLKQALWAKVSPCIAVSKLYPPEESWTKGYVWWFDLPIDKIDKYLDRDYYLVCEKKGKGFSILKVPNHFLKKNLGKFEIQNKRIRLHLGVVKDTLFIDQRGKGNVDFSSYLID